MSDESKQNKHEELTDIAKELRELSESAKYRESQPTVYGKPIFIYFAEVADRIEAIDSADAWRSLYTPGNAAAMREALVAIRDTLCEHPYDHDDDGLVNIANTALAAPARQCDVGTAEEQADRFGKLCGKHYNEEEQCNEKCPLASLPITHGFPRCQAYWAQTTYAEEGGAK